MWSNRSDAATDDLRASIQACVRIHSYDLAGLSSGGRTNGKHWRSWRRSPLVDKRWQSGACLARLAAAGQQWKKRSWFYFLTKYNVWRFLKTDPLYMAVFPGAARAVDKQWTTFAWKLSVACAAFRKRIQCSEFGGRRRDRVAGKRCLRVGKLLCLVKAAGCRIDARARFIKPSSP